MLLALHIHCEWKIYCKGGVLDFSYKNHVIASEMKGIIFRVYINWPEINMDLCLVSFDCTHQSLSYPNSSKQRFIFTECTLYIAPSISKNYFFKVQGCLYIRTG